jgi:hypothetical protein
LHEKLQRSRGVLQTRLDRLRREAKQVADTKEPEQRLEGAAEKDGR